MDDAPVTLPPELAGAPDRRAAPGHVFGGLIGTSAIMQHLYERIEHASGVDDPVFISGETGSGRKTCAEALHRCGPRSGQPFRILRNATAEMLEDAFAETAGTLVIAGADTLAPDIQEIWLSMRRGPRIVCTGARRLPGGFLALAIPPLRARGEDVIDIAIACLRSWGRAAGKNFSHFTEEAEGLLRRYTWPGNIRELQAIVRRIVAMPDAAAVTAGMLSGALREERDAALWDGDDEILPLAEVERAAIERAIRLCAGNIPQAAARLGVSPSTLYRKRAEWLQEPG